MADDLVRPLFMGETPQVLPATLDEYYMNEIRRMEGFSSRPYWDVRQWSSGYGTRAGGPNESIDRETANRRLTQEVDAAERSVDAFQPNLDPGTRAALSSLTFNAGPSWQRSGLGRAVQAGDTGEITRLLNQYNRSDGVVNRGLVNRRATEASWIGRGPMADDGMNPFSDNYPPQPAVAPASAPTQPPAPAAPSDPRNTPQPQGSWSSWLSNPANRAFLISFGTHLATPSWGGPMAQIAGAIGAGAEAQAATSNKQAEQDFNYSQLASREREGALTRQNQLAVADISAGSRAEVANIRSSAMLERAKLIGLRTGQQQNEFTRLVQRLYATEVTSLINPTPAEREAAFQRAMDTATTAMRATGRGPSGQPLPGDAASPAVPPDAPIIAPPPAAAAPAPAAPAAPATPPLAPGEAAPGSLAADPAFSPRLGNGAPVSPTPVPASPAVPTPNTFQEFLKDPRSREILKNPQLLQRLFQARPAWQQEYELMRQSPSPGALPR